MPTGVRRYKLKAGVLNVNTGGEQVLMDYASGKYFGLRGSAACVLDSLREGAEITALVDRVVAEYDVSEVAAREDLAAILQKLTDTGLVLVE